jgi:hypothetical protein
MFNFFCHFHQNFFVTDFEAKKLVCLSLKYISGWSNVCKKEGANLSGAPYLVPSLTWKC